jgi:hypothetical protein
MGQTGTMDHHIRSVCLTDLLYSGFIFNIRLYGLKTGSFIRIRVPVQSNDSVFQTKGSAYGPAD